MWLILNSQVEVNIHEQPNSEKYGKNLLSLTFYEDQTKENELAMVEIEKVIKSHPNFVTQEESKITPPTTTYFYLKQTKLIEFILWLVSQGIGVKEQ